MKKILFILGIIVIVLLGVYYFNRTTRTNVILPSDPKSAEFTIEGQRTKIGENTKYFGNELKSDLNGDGRQDVVFIVTQNTGGSGTFYYAVAAVDTGHGYVGSDGYLLGDRIAPQTTEVSQNLRHKGVIVVNYADRGPSEPMTTAPSIGKSAYLKLGDDLKWGIVVNDFEGE